jgi:translation elongation factor EF-Ts
VSTVPSPKKKLVKIQSKKKYLYLPSSKGIISRINTGKNSVGVISEANNETNFLAKPTTSRL